MTSRTLWGAFLVGAVAVGISPGRRAGGQTDASASGGATPSYVLLATPVKHVRGELTVALTMPKLQAEEWIVYAARLPELPGQSGVRSALQPNGHPSQELSAEGRAVLFARVPVRDTKQRHALTIRLEYEATLLARKLVRRRPGMVAPQVAPLSAETQRLALAKGDLFDFDSPAFQRWLDEHRLRREPQEKEIDFARRAFTEIKDVFKYTFHEGMDRKASHVCEAGTSDCGGLSIVLVSTLRANGIPARVLSGRWAMSSQNEPGKAPYDQQHVKVEFFAQSVGWVPADPAPAVAYDKSPGGLRYFGNDPGDFVTMHVGNNLELDTFLFGRKTIEWLQTPAFWVSGAGSMDPMTSKEKWEVQAEPLDLREAVFRKPANNRRPSATKKSQNGPATRPMP
jgi:transglutaminase-like putative cysteine protease